MFMRIALVPDFQAMRIIKLGVFGLGLTAAVTAVGQSAHAPPPPPTPQFPAMGFRPIRPPQLAPIQLEHYGYPVRPPLAPPSQNQFARPNYTFSPPGVTPRPGQPVPFNTSLTPQVGQPVTVAQPKPPQPAHYLVWDSERRDISAKPGEMSVNFTFWFTNVSSEVVTINRAWTSCGCTIAQLPAQPWQIPPGSNGPIVATMHLAGKVGAIEKAVTVDSTTGYKTLIVRANLPTPANTASTGTTMGIDSDRLKNMQMALADRQVLFKGDCAKCHSEPAQGKTGEQLYVAACGICHDSVHRAAMVPDLKALKNPTNEEHWRKWIKSGRPGSMMPAFAKAEGGPLSDEQIESLVKHLMQTVTSKAAPQAQAKAAPAQHDSTGVSSTKVQ